MSSLATRLSKAFDPERHTKADLARAAKVSAASVSDWFSGETKTLKADPMVRAAAYLDVEPLWLVAGEGPMKSKRVGATYATPFHVSENIVPLSQQRWEFTLIDPQRWASCSETEKGFVQGAMNAALSEIESRRAKLNGTDSP